MATTSARRTGVIVALAVLFGAVVAASLTVKAPKARIALSAEANPVARFSGATSQLWSCAGPLPVGEASARSAIEVTNSTRSPATARYSFATTGATRKSGDAFVAPGAVVLLRPPNAREPGFAAARIVVEGASVSVVEVVHASTGPIEAPCTPAAATSSYVVAGDTRKSDNVTLSLYDPGATPAVASVSVATPSGVQSPPSLQGLPVGAGQIVTYSIAQRVPFASEMAITVHASAGSLVVGGLSTFQVSGVLIAALEPAIAAPASHWWFAAAPTGPTAQQTIDLLNPTRATARVSVLDSTSGGSARLRVVMAPLSVAHVALPSEPTTRALGSVEVSAARGVAVVAARTVIVGAVIHAAQLPEKSALQRAKRALELVPTTPIGYTVTNGSPAVAREWIIGGGEQDKSNSTELVITNPFRRPARVDVRSSATHRPWISGLNVAGGTTAVVNLADLPLAQGRFALRVSASSPVICEGTIYASGSTGFTSPAAIPLD